MLGGLHQPVLNPGNDGDGGDPHRHHEPTLIEKYGRILEYLKSLPSENNKATAVDFMRELNIDLSDDVQLVETLKSKSQFIIISEGNNGEFVFQYRTKYIIKNKAQLLNELEKDSRGIMLKDVQLCYTGIEADCNSMVVGGDLIASMNRDEHTPVFFPRGEAFLVPLSGKVKAIPGSPIIETTVDLRNEIRRGEAICVNGWWYRVSSRIEGNKQLARATAPLSVTLNQNMSSKNVYIYEFTDKSLPLDGEFNGQEVFEGVAFRHGCTLDMKNLWGTSLQESKLGTITGASTILGTSILADRKALRKRLLEEKLVEKDLKVVVKKQETKDTRGTQQRRRRVIRQQKAPVKGAFGVNAHLDSSSKEAKAIEEARQRRYREEAAGIRK